jgi:hypothetical protein
MATAKATARSTSRCTRPITFDGAVNNRNAARVAGRMEGLERPKFRRRRRWATLVIALAIPAHLAALYALLARPDRVTYTIHVDTLDTTQVVNLPAPPIVVTVPVPVPNAPPRTCPAPNKTAKSGVVPDLPAVTGLYASPTNADWIVGWNEASIYSSSDGGRSFTEVLQGSGRVHSVALDCFGHVIAARGTQIGVRDGIAETWNDVPGIELTERVYEGGYPSDPPDVWIVGGGADVVVVGFQSPYADWKPRAAISHDLGRSWSYRDITAEGFEGTHLSSRIRPTGEIDLELEIVDCGGEWMETFTIANGAVTRNEEPVQTDEISDEDWRAKTIKREPWRDSDVSIDAAGRRWAIECGQLAILKKNERPSCDEGEGNE